VSRHERLIRAWFEERARPGEAFVDWGVLARYPQADHASFSAAEGHRIRLADARGARLAAAGVVPESRVLPGVTDPFAAVSDQRLILGRSGGFRFTPREELLSLDRPTFRVLWWDEPQPGPDKRHLIVQVDDGRWWDTSSLVHDNVNADAFLAALGPNAVHLGG